MESGVWVPMTPGKPALTSEQGTEKRTDCFDTTRYPETCVMNEMCEFPPGILDEYEELFSVDGQHPKVDIDTCYVKEETVKKPFSEGKKAHGAESEDGIGSIPTPAKPKETRKRRSDGFDMNKKPSQRPRVKKHRPKILDDSRPKTVQKAQNSCATSRPKTPKPATPNRVQERKTQSRKNKFTSSTNCKQKSTGYGFKDVGQDVPEPYRSSVDHSCKRLLDFGSSSLHKESKSHEKPLLIGFKIEKFDCFRHKIVTSKRNTSRRSKFLNREDTSITRIEEQVDRYGRKYVCFYQRRKKTVPTLQVYQRSFRPNQCLQNSRKCGPNFPKLFKKQRMLIQNGNMKGHKWRIVADELHKNLMIRSRKLTQTTRKKVQNRANKSKYKEEVVKLNLYTDELLPVFLHPRRRRSVIHTRLRESVTEFPYDSNEFLLCREENFLQSLQDVPIQRIWSFTSQHQVFPRFDNIVGYPNRFQLQDAVVLESQSLTPRHQHILHTREDLNEFIASEVELLIGKIASLDINDQCKELVVRDINVSGTLVKVLPRKKRNMLPKVDLDNETLRVWKLLMENNESEPVEETDKDKEEWWETQRNIFRGRVDSFIAKMHLIQGNRRFSPWKGSVTDSVVGVYLTQNVSDHFSSSAFMCVAAKYPVNSKSKEVNEKIEVPESQESVSSNAQTHEGIFKNNEMDQDGIDELESSLTGSKSSTNEPSTSTFDVNVGQYETSESQLIGQQKPTPVEEPKSASSPICSLQSEVTIEQGGDPATNHKEKPVEDKEKEKSKIKKDKKKEPEADWEEFRRRYCKITGEKEVGENFRDAVDWDAVRRAPVEEIAEIIVDRGMNNIIAKRIKEFLNRIHKDHGTLDLEWLRDVPPEKAKEFLLSIEGLGLKSVECVRLLTLHHNAFPVDTNVGRVATRLGWVPLQPLPDEVQIHLLNAYPMVDNIQKYLYPRLCTLDQKTLYELHYQLITFGKVFCTKRNPNCNACPMRAECRHYASAFASGRLALPGTKESSNVTSIVPVGNQANQLMQSQPSSSFDPEVNNMGSTYQSQSQTCEPIIEVPPSPEPEVKPIIGDIEDFCWESDNDDEDEIPVIRLNTEEFRETLKETIDTNSISIPDADMSKALITWSAEPANVRVPVKKFAVKSRTMHLVYELPDFHQVLTGFEAREHDDPTPYLLAIWLPDEIPNSLEYTENRTYAADNNTLEETVKATILIPCRTATRGRFPLNGTYFQVNEVFADDETSHSPMEVPRGLLCNLRLRELGCGTSATSIFKALSTGAIQRLFWRGSICVRGFNRKRRRPRPLHPIFHISSTAKNKKSAKEFSNS